MGPTYPNHLDDAGLLAARLEEDAGMVRLSLTGELDASVTSALELLVADLAAVPDVVILLDLEALAFCDLAGLRGLHAAHDAAGGRIAATGVPPSVTRLLEILGASDCFAVPPGDRSSGWSCV